MEPEDSSARNCGQGTCARICACNLLTSSAVNPDSLERLTDRESEVLELLATGVSNRGISRTLSVSERTIKAHLTRIFEKLGVQSRLQAALTLIVSRWRTCPTALADAVADEAVVRQRE